MLLGLVLVFGALTRGEFGLIALSSVFALRDFMVLVRAGLLHHQSGRWSRLRALRGGIIAATYRVFDALLLAVGNILALRLEFNGPLMCFRRAIRRGASGEQNRNAKGEDLHGCCFETVARHSLIEAIQLDTRHYGLAVEAGGVEIGIAGLPGSKGNIAADRLC